MGDGVACLELHTKMNSFAPEVMDILEETVTLAGSRFRALVLGNDDPRAFSAGADLSFILGMLKGDDRGTLDTYITRNQRLFLRLKYAPVPVVAAMHGFALGGGCEFALHADAIVAHAELTAGLPEISVGLIPAWGGCTQLLLHAAALDPAATPAEIAARVFATIFPALKSASAEQAREMGILRPDDGIVMHRAHLLAAAKARALEPGRGLHRAGKGDGRPRRCRDGGDPRRAGEGGGRGRQGHGDRRDDGRGAGSGSLRRAGHRGRPRAGTRPG